MEIPGSHEQVSGHLATPQARDHDVEIVTGDHGAERVHCDLLRRGPSASLAGLVVRDRSGWLCSGRLRWAQPSRADHQEHAPSEQAIAGE